MGSVAATFHNVALSIRAENRVKGHESSKLDQKHLFSTHLRLIRNLFTLSLRKSVYVTEDCKCLKIRLLPSGHFLMLLFCSVAPQHPSMTDKIRARACGQNNVVGMQDFRFFRVAFHANSICIK